VFTHVCPALEVAHGRYAICSDPNGHGTIGRVCLPRRPFAHARIYSLSTPSPSTCTLAAGDMVKTDVFFSWFYSHIQGWPSIHINPLIQIGISWYIPFLYMIIGIEYPPIIFRVVGATHCGMEDHNPCTMFWPYRTDGDILIVEMN